ncbi:DUF1206 domain-containing protein [Microbacterium dauci]|uniref:DUF1206 domain-containing protein n=1 Tax=Microbacterium dauci TaxID=3048008 RepID=A0ABT6ZEZ7_9MICO|nr:DUF1206 domain-containing protein [Microbacterium sp. LX3-4]MDJ1114723.1 DUF1206 domain-containing protein [Microbacterium sp. LX3-4]
MSDSAKTAARAAKNSTAVRTLARVGFAASGIVHILIGIIAVSVATGGSGGDNADQSGALARLSEVPGGVFLLWAAAISLAALGVWHVLDAFLDRTASGRDRVSHIVKNVGKGVVYLTLAGTCTVFATGGSASSSGSTKSLTAQLLAAPGGVLAVAGIGLVMLGIAGYLVFKGATRRFERDLRMPSGAAAKGVRVLGTVGYIARGLALAAVGVLFLVGAITHDPDRSTGLDGALRSFADLPFGKIILILIGAGWMAYGVYAFVRARLARL